MSDGHSKSIDLCNIIFDMISLKEGTNLLTNQFVFNIASVVNVVEVFIVGKVHLPLMIMGQPLLLNLDYHIVQFHLFYVFQLVLVDGKSISDLSFVS